MTVTNIISFYMKTARGVEREGFANFVHVVVYCKLFFPAEIRSIMENPNYNKRDVILYIGNLLAIGSLQHRQDNTDVFLR